MAHCAEPLHKAEGSVNIIFAGAALHAHTTQLSRIITCCLETYFERSWYSTNKQEGYPTAQFSFVRVRFTLSLRSWIKTYNLILLLLKESYIAASQCFVGIIFTKNDFFHSVKTKTGQALHHWWQRALAWGVLGCRSHGSRGHTIPFKTLDEVCSKYRCK